MPISLISVNSINSINSTTKFNGFNKKANMSAPKIEIMQKAPQANYLIDSNYGRSLVKNSNLSFTSNLPTFSVTLTRKITAGLNILKHNEVLLVGKNFQEANKALKDSIGTIPDVIKKILFISDDKIERSLAIFKDNKDYDELVNLNKGTLIVKSEHLNQSFNIKKGENLLIIDGDEVLSSGSPFSVFTRLNTDDIKMNDIQKEFIQQIDLSHFDNGDVARINTKRLDLLEKGKTQTELSKISFADVAGQDEAIDEIKQKIVRPIKYPNFFKNIKTPKSTLFIGPPGNGKTLAARALANEINVPFYSLNGQLLEGKFVGESAKNIHEYYETAKQNQPCIIFYDEMEAIFGKRTGTHKYAEDSLNMHLDEISQLEKENAQVYLVGATNRPELIDEAALRDGRFGTHILFKNPDLEGCKKIFKTHTKSTIIKNFNIDQFVEKIHAASLSGANIAGIANNATLNAIERLGIYKAMDKGTFIDAPDYKLIVKGEDFEKALARKIEDNKMLKEYEDKAKKLRSEEIKTDYRTRVEAEKELSIETKNAERRPKVGFVKESV